MCCAESALIAAISFFEDLILKFGEEKVSSGSGERYLDFLTTSDDLTTVNISPFPRNLFIFLRAPLSPNDLVDAVTGMVVVENASRCFGAVPVCPNGFGFNRISFAGTSPSQSVGAIPLTEVSPVGIRDNVIDESRALTLFQNMYDGSASTRFVNEIPQRVSAVGANERGEGILNIPTGEVMKSKN
jgi:hypothetical protein